MWAVTLPLYSVKTFFLQRLETQGSFWTPGLIEGPFVCRLQSASPVLQHPASRSKGGRVLGIVSPSEGH